MSPAQAAMDRARHRARTMGKDLSHDFITPLQWGVRFFRDRPGIENGPIILSAWEKSTRPGENRAVCNRILTFFFDRLLLLRAERPRYSRMHTQRRPAGRAGPRTCRAGGPAPVCRCRRRRRSSNGTGLGCPSYSCAMVSSFTGWSGARFGHLFDKLPPAASRREAEPLTPGCEGVLQVGEEQLCRVDLHLVVGVRVLPRPGTGSPGRRGPPGRWW